MRVFPSISQIETWPVAMFCHRMSELVSLALNSPVPTARQSGPGLGVTGPPPIRVFPSISQTAAWPLAFCHRISAVIAVGGSAGSLSITVVMLSKTGAPLALL
jgi:hypothetical protein